MTGYTNQPLPTKIGGRGKPNDSALVDLESTTKGFLKPRMTTAERLALTPVEGLEVFDTDLGLPFVYGNGAWGSFAGIPAAGSSTDNAIVRWDGASGTILQDSPVTISDTGDIDGALSADIGNVNITGNEISTTDVDGDITINPNGTGKVVIAKDLQVMGTTTTVESQTMEVVDSNITINKNGDQTTADLNDAGITVEMSDATNAIIHYDSTATSKWKAGEVGSTKEIATISDVQDLTNKRLSNGAVINANLDLQIESTTKASKPWPSMTTAQRDALTPVDGAVIKNTDTDALETYSTTEGAWIPLGAGGGLDQWVTATDYEVGDVVWESNSNIIFRCIADHTASADIITDLANWESLSGSGLATGVITGCVMSINVGDAATLDVTAGKVRIVDRTTGSNLSINFAGATGAAVPDIATQGQSYVSINNAGALIFEASEPTETLRRTQVYLGKIIHEGNTVIEVVSNQQEVAYGATNSIADFFRSYNLVNLEGNKFTGTGLDLNYGGGKIFSVGSNYSNDVNNPHVKTFAAANPLSFRYRAIDGTQGAVVNAIDPTVYESAPNVYTTIGGSANRATNVRVYLFPSGVIRVMAGQQFYTNIAAAIQALPTETHAIEANIEDNATLVCVIVVRQGATDLNLSSDAIFLYPNAFGQISLGASGFSVSSLQNAYNNSENPEIVVDATRGAVTVKDNATPIDANLIEATDNADAEVFGVDLTETRVKQLGFTDSTVAKVSSTVGDNVQVTDDMGSRVLRRESKLLFVEDFKENAPTTFLTASNAAITVNDATNANYLTNQIATFTQSSATTGQYVETNAIPVTKFEWLLEPIKAKFMQGVSGGAGTWKLELFTSTDDVTYTNSNIQVDLGELKYDKIISQLASDVSSIKFRWTIAIADDATTLTLGGLMIENEAFSVGQTLVSHKINRTGSFINGGLSNPAWTSGYTLDLLTGTSESGASVLARENISGYTVFTAMKDCEVDLNLILLSNAVGNYIKVYDYDSQEFLSTGTTAQGGNEYMDSPPRFSLSRGQRFIVNVTNYNSGASNKANIVATAYADNVIVDAATSGLNTINAGALTISATTTAPTKGTVVTDNVWVVYNANDTATIRFEYRQSGTGVAGSGDYLFKMPNGLEIDTDKVTPYTTVEGGAGGYLAPNSVGFASMSYSGTDAGGGSLVVYDKDYVRMAVFHDTGEGYVGSNWFGLHLLDMTYSGSFTVPIKGRRIDSLPIQVGVSSERENNYQALVDGTNSGTFAPDSWNVKFIESITKNSTGNYTVTWVSGFFSVAPAVTCEADSVTVGNIRQCSVANVTTTGCTIGTNEFNASAVDLKFWIKASRQLSDYREPKAFVANAVSLTNHVTGGTEYLTNESVDGKPVYARLYQLTSNISSNTLIDVIDTDLVIINGTKTGASEWTLNGSYMFLNTNYSQKYYSSSSGEVRIFTNGVTLYSGDFIKLEYLKP